MLKNGLIMIKKYNYFFILIFVCLFHLSIQLINIDTSFRIYALHSNDPIYLYFFDNFYQNLILFLSGSNDQFQTPLNYSLIKLSDWLNKEYGLIVLNFLSSIILIISITYLIKQFFEIKNVNIILIFFIFFNIFLFFDIFYKNIFQITILPRIIIGNIIFFYAISHLIKIVKEEKDEILIFLLFAFFLLLFNFFLFTFFSLISAFFFRFFFKKKNILQILFFFILSSAYILYTSFNIDNSKLGVGYENIDVVRTLFDLLSRKIFLLLISLCLINILLSCLLFKNNERKFLLSFGFSILFIPIIFICSGLNFQNYHFLDYSFFLLCIYFIINLLKLFKNYESFIFKKNLKFILILSLLMGLTLHFYISDKKPKKINLSSEYQTLIRKELNKDIFTQYNLKNLETLISYLTENYRKKHVIISNSRFLNNYLTYIHNSKVVFKNRVHKMNIHNDEYFNLLSNVQIKDKHICKEQLVFNYMTHYKYFLSKNTKLNINKLDMIDEDKNLFKLHTNVFRKYYYVNKSLIYNNFSDHSQFDILYVIFKDNVCSNIKFEKVFYENQDFIIGNF